MRSSRLPSLKPYAACLAAALAVLPAVATVPSAAGARAATSGYVYEREWTVSASPYSPEAVTVGGNGVVYAFDGQSSGDGTAMRSYAADGTLLGTWSLNDQVEGADVDAAGNLVLALSTNPPNGDIKVYTPTGQLLRTYGIAYGVDGYTWWAPDDVAVAADGSSYALESLDHRLAKFAADGTYLGSIGSYGAGPGQFDSPGSVAVGPDGSIYVSDDDNSRIQRFSADGDLLSLWGRAGSGIGEFDGRSRTVEVAPNGHVFVADGSSRIQEFSADGAYLSTVPDRLSQSTDLGFAPDGTLYVSGWLESGRSGIAKFVPASPTPSPTPTPTPPPPPSDSDGSAKITSKRVKVEDGKARLRIACSQGSAKCTGTIDVRAKGKRIAKGRYSVPPAAMRTVTVKLTKTGRKALRSKASLRAVATLIGTNGERVSRRVRLVR